VKAALPKTVSATDFSSEEKVWVPFSAELELLYFSLDFSPAPIFPLPQDAERLQSFPKESAEDCSVDETTSSV